MLWSRETTRDDCREIALNTSQHQLSDPRKLFATLLHLYPIHQDSSTHSSLFCPVYQPYQRHRSAPSISIPGIPATWRKTGFHLLELLIVLAILAILALIGLPTYQSYLTQSARIAAATTLTKLAARLAEYHFTHQSYAGVTLEELHFPATTSHQRYQLMIASATVDQFLIRAQPLGQQAKQDSTCGSLALDAQGIRSISGPGQLEECW